MVISVVFIGGRSGVGKTSVAFEVHARLGTADVAHCLIDGDFLDMAHPPPWEHGLAERNLAAMWRNYRALGYQRMIYTNTVSVLPDVIERLTNALGDDSKILAILLTCTDSTARKRLSQREIGSALNRHLASSAEMADLLNGGATKRVHRIPTDDRSITEITADVIALTGWLKDDH